LDLGLFLPLPVSEDEVGLGQHCSGPEHFLLVEGVARLTQANHDATGIAVLLKPVDEPLSLVTVPLGDEHHSRVLWLDFAEGRRKEGCFSWPGVYEYALTGLVHVESGQLAQG
jgi:hypothetical protein